MNIFLIILLLHYVGLILFKPKQNTLNCGIFGWFGSDIKNFNKDKFDKLGMYNESRGKSSCGIAYDGDVFIGMNTRKLYTDFIVDLEMNLEKYPIVIGHTRQASPGTTVTTHNAHPFSFGMLENSDYEFIGCHNGTLYNKVELAETYGVDLKAEYSDYNITLKKFEQKERDKIDSEILLESIYKSKNFKVLSDYLGGAALFFTNLNEPNVAYLFKGKSKMHSYSKEETEERPLFVFIENKNSMYVSSIEDSLRSIGGNDDNVIDIECNVVYKITNGDFMAAEKISITRVNAQQTIRPLNSSKNHNSHMSHFPNEYFNEDYFGDIIDNRAAKAFPKETTKNLLPSNKSSNQSSLFLNIYEEDLLKSQKDYKSSIYFHKLRFKRNGHPITGIYTFIMGFGYYLLSDTPKRAEDHFWDLIDKPFNRKTGNFEDLILDTDMIIPFKSESVMEPTLYFFVEGVQIRTAIDYSVFYSKWQKLKKGEWLNYIELSNVSTHPIINYNFKTKPLDEQFATMNSRVYNGTIVPLGSEKKYTFEKGNLIKLEDSSYYNFFKNYVEKEEKKEEEKETSSNVNQILKVSEEISEQNDDALLAEMIKAEEEQNELINEIINEDFAEPIQDFQKTKDKLSSYKNNNYASNIINFIDKTIEGIAKLTKI